MVHAPPPPSRPDRPPVGASELSREIGLPGGFWIRFVAYMVDGFIVTVVLGILIGIVIVAIALGGRSLDDDAETLLIVADVVALIVASIVINWLYEALLTSSPRGAALGKQILDLRIVRADGAQLSFGRATARHFLKYMVTPLVPLFIGYLMAAFTARKRALHDVLAETLVIRSH
jgi:uncharacterized RDD family membrane protein YckC